MKQTLPFRILALSFCATLSFAEPATFQQRFDEAFGFYTAGNFQKAYELFDSLWEASAEDPEVNFYLGRSALELKRYDDAGIAFDRVLMVNPNHDRTRLEMARLYFETQQYEAAQRELDGITSEKLPQNVQDMVTSMRRSLGTHESPHSVRGALMLALDYDTNIANDVGRGITQNVFTSINDRRKSAGLAEILLFNHAYDMGEKGGWRWESTFLGYNKNLNNHSDRDLLIFTLGSGPTYTFDSYKLSFLASYDKVHLGAEDYLGTAGFGINLKKILSPSLLIEGDISTKRTLYADAASTSDFDAMIYSLGMRQSFDNGGLLLSAYLSYKDDSERDNAAVQYGVSKAEWACRLEASKEITKGLRGSVAYTYKDIAYDEYDTLLLVDRSDKEHYYSLGLTYAIDKDSSISLNHSYTDHNSNNALGEYTKNVTSLAYIRNF